jgi:hypothetical protein
MKYITKYVYLLQLLWMIKSTITYMNQLTIITLSPCTIYCICFIYDVHTHIHNFTADFFRFRSQPFEYVNVINFLSDDWHNYVAAISTEVVIMPNTCITDVSRIGREWCNPGSFGSWVWPWHDHQRRWLDFDMFENDIRSVEDTIPANCGKLRPFSRSNWDSWKQVNSWSMVFRPRHIRDN